MAKKTKVDITDYIQGLPGLDDESKKLLSEKLSASPEAVKQLQNELMSSSDYQSHMAELERERKAAEQAKADAENLRLLNENWYKENVGSGMMDNLKRENEMYRQTYGAYNQPVQPVYQAQQVNGDYMSRKDFEEALAKERAAQQDWAAGLTAMAVPLAIKHFQEFGKTLDMGNLIKKAVEVRNAPTSPINTAYDLLTAEDRAARAAEAQKAHDDQIRKDAIRDYQSRQPNEINARPEDHGLLYTALRKETPKSENPAVTQGERLKSFQSIWRQTADELDAKSSAAH